MKVQRIIDRCAAQLRDPAKGRITNGIWLDYYNEAAEDITLNFKVLERDSSHDILENESRYVYPDDCVQLKKWKYSNTPSASPPAWTKAGEWFEDEFDSVTARGSVPTGDINFHYLARAGFFEITPLPTATVPDGGLVSYWKLAAEVTDPELEIELPATMFKFIRERMVLSVKRDLSRNDEWPTLYQAWLDGLSAVYDRIEDRSDDRREALRPQSLRRGFSRMV